MVDDLMALKNRTFEAARHILKRLTRQPLLLGWIAVGSIIEIVYKGYTGLIITVINLILLGVYAVIIKVGTETSWTAPVQPLKIKHPGLELLLGILLYIIIIINISSSWGQTKIPYISSSIFNMNSTLEHSVLNSIKIGVPEWAVDTLANAASSTALELVPTVILFACLGYGFKRMGFVFKNLCLTLVLLVVSIILGLPFSVIPQNPYQQIIPLLFIMMFVNGLPEELFYRGYLLPRLEAVLKNPINALVISAILFNLLHVPVNVLNGMSVSSALVLSFGIGYPTGLIWGYLYMKTRSIVPGIIWHTSNSILGIIFFGV